jgi:putative nucleotidyltransferase with HDIG domain
VATSALPAEVQKLFRRTVPIGIEHGTVAVVLGKGRQVEVTTYRGEGAYSDGRHPDSVTFVRTLEEDLQRRDLTINAMAIDPDQRRLVDPMGGECDLHLRLIRAVGDPMERFAEDGLRTMRAVRFAAVLEFQVEEATRRGIGASLDSFRKVSRERVRDELLKLLGAPRPSVGIELMQETGLLVEVLPELCAARGVTQNRYHQEDVYAHSLRACDLLRADDSILRLAALLHDVGKPETVEPHPDRPGEHTFHGHEKVGEKLCRGIARRLRLSNEQSDHLCHLVRHHNFTLEGWRAAGLRRFARRVGPEHLEDLRALREADLLGREGPDQLPLLEAMWSRLEEVMRAQPPLSARQLAVDGNRIMQHLGISPGPRVGQIIRQLMERVLDDPELNTEERLLELVDQLEERPG